MRGPVKIVTIGGGSSYTPELMEGFIKRYEELPIREIWLADIEDRREKLESVGPWPSGCGTPPPTTSSST